jgi:hypothetical protein
MCWFDYLMSPIDTESQNIGSLVLPAFILKFVMWGQCFMTPSYWATPCLREIFMFGFCGQHEVCLTTQPRTIFDKFNLEDNFLLSECASSELYHHSRSSFASALFIPVLP